MLSIRNNFSFSKKHNIFEQDILTEKVYRSEGNGGIKRKGTRDKHVYQQLSLYILFPFKK